MTAKGSFWLRLKRAYFMRNKIRYLSNFELSTTYNESSDEIEIEISGDRRLLQIELFIRGDGSPTVEFIKCPAKNKSAKEFSVTTTVQESDGVRTLVIVPDELVWANAVTILLLDPPDSFEYKINIAVVADRHPDFLLLRQAFTLNSSGEDELAVKYVNDYQQLNETNPHAYHLLSILNQRLKNHDSALEASLQAMGRGLIEDGVDIFRSLKETDDKTPVEEIRKLQDESRSWELRGNIGVLLLEKKQRISFGYGKCFHYYMGQISEVKRTAAARMLRSINFPLSTSSEFLLHTRMHILHRDDSVENVPLERFTLTDAADKNLFITVQDDREGHWILPDLETGDIIIWTLDILGNLMETKNGQQFFRLSRLFDESHPTYRGVIEYVMAAKTKLSISCLNWHDSFVEEKEAAGERRITRFIGTRFLPIKHTGFAHEDNHLNPVAAAAFGPRSWIEVDQQISAQIFGENPEDDLPSPLEEIANNSDDPLPALEEAFCWIRDKLKYASLKSANERIGQKKRAASIVESGMADCKDRAYLMSIFCRKIGIPCQYVMISSASGIVVKDLPADQFDHVFVRIKTKERWIYLDSTNSEATFGSTPYWCQGMSAMILDGNGTIETIPEDSSELNSLEIHESIEDVTDGWLAGSIDIVARGHIGRSFSESWKSLSLLMDDQQRAATEALRRYLPSSVITQAELISEDSAKNIFHLSALMRRCPLIRMQGGDHVAMFNWSLPFLPVSYWRVLHIGEMFVFNFPCRIKFAVTFGPRITPLLKDLSRLETYDGNIGRIVETVDRRDGLLTIIRSITIDKKIIRHDLTDQIPALLERTEEALRLVATIKFPENN